MPPDDVAAPAAVEAVAEPVAPAAEPGDKPKAGSPELARWHAARAQAVVDKERAGAPPEPVKETPPKDPKTGKFLKQPKPSGKEAAAKAEPAAPTAEKPKEPDKPAEKLPDSLAAIRRMWNEGKKDEAIQRAFGKPMEQLFDSEAYYAFRKETGKVRTELQRERETLASQRQQLEQVRQEAIAELKPLADGRRAFQAGDYEEAFRLWTGEDINSFQRKALQQRMNPGVGKDPVITELRNEIQAMRRENQELREREQQEASERQKRDRVQKYWSDMTSELEGSDNPQVANAAKRPAFRQKVFEIQRAHYDASSDSTLPTLEAAELALDALIAEHREWGSIFQPEPSGNTRQAPVPSGQSRTLPSGAAIPAKPAMRVATTTTLSQKDAAEAAAAPKLKGRALLDKYVRLGHQLVSKENGVG